MTTSGSQENYRVLIVDDDEDLGKMLAQYLPLCGPFEADNALSIHSLWEKLSQKKWDLLMLDYNLPDGDGLTLLAELHNQSLRIPVVMITGQGDERTAAQAIQRGAMDYIVKDGSFEFIHSLPGTLQKAIQYNRLQMSAEKAFKKIRYQAFLLDNVQDAVVVWDKQGTITFWNHAAECLFGRLTSEQIGKSINEDFVDYFSPTIQFNKPDSFLDQELEHRFISRSNQSIWISSRVTSLHEHNTSPKEITGYMIISRDISERKNMQAQMQAAQAQVIQSVRSAAVGELASGVAHQINNPLTTIIADAQLLRHQISEDHPAWESVNAIEQAGWRTQQIVQLLMEFSQPFDSISEDVDLNQTIENAMILVGSHIQNIDAEIKLNLTQPSPIIMGNRQQFENLWVYLLLMARDALRTAYAEKTRDKTIQINSFSSPAPTNSLFIVIEVHDNGTPIPANQIERLFEPNFMAPASGRGSGIDFFICREILKQFQAQIQVNSNPIEGTTIRVTIPSRG